MKFKPWRLIYYEAYTIKEDAINREKFLKSGSGKRYLDKQLKEYFKNNPRRKLWNLRSSLFYEWRAAWISHCVTWPQSGFT